MLIRRFKNGQKYVVFPGGGIEAGETPEEATIREIKEELSLDAKIDKFLFKKFNPGKPEIGSKPRDHYYFLITEFTGNVKLGGIELETMNENEQYYPNWYDLKEAEKLENLYPQKAKEKLFKILNNITEK